MIEERKLSFKDVERKGCKRVRISFTRTVPFTVRKRGEKKARRVSFIARR